MDEILIRGLETRCIIGDNDWERDKEQEVVVDLDLRTDTRPAARTDDLDDALDYRALKKDVLAYVEDSDHRLLETLAEGIANVCLEYDRLESVRVRVDKPGALRFSRTVAVEIEREA
jgi:FolB domain-containing protein